MLCAIYFAAAQGEPPNIIFIMADDLVRFAIYGYISENVSCLYTTYFLLMLYVLSVCSLAGTDALFW